MGTRVAPARLSLGSGVSTEEEEVEDQEDRRDRDDGTERVHEHRAEVPGPGRTAAQTVVVIIGVIVLVAALLWFVLPLVAG